MGVLRRNITLGIALGSWLIGSVWFGVLEFVVTLKSWLQLDNQPTFSLANG